MSTPKVRLPPEPAPKHHVDQGVPPTQEPRAEGPASTSDPAVAPDVYVPTGTSSPPTPVTQIQSPTRYDPPFTLYQPRVGEEGNPLASTISTRFQEALRRLSQAYELPILELLPGVRPTATLLDFAQTEYRILRGDHLVNAAFSSTGLAGQFATGWLVNNVPNSIITIDEIIIAQNVTGGVIAGKITGATPTQFLPLFRRDLRNTPTLANATLGGYVAATSEAAAPGPIHGLDTLLPANTPFAWHPEIVLLNGFAYFVTCATAGTNVLSLTFNARIRLNVEKTELENFPAS